MGSSRPSGGMSGLIVALVLSLTLAGSAALAAPADAAARSTELAVTSTPASASPSAGDVGDTRLLVTYEHHNSVEVAVASLAAANIC